VEIYRPNLMPALAFRRSPIPLGVFRQCRDLHQKLGNCWEGYDYFSLSR
jgi:hypothetical protein